MTQGALVPLPSSLKDCYTVADVEEFLRPVFRQLARGGIRVTSGWDHGIFSAYFAQQPHAAVPVIVWFATLEATVSDPNPEAAVTLLAGREAVSRTPLRIREKPLAHCSQDELVRELPALLDSIAVEIDGEAVRQLDEAVQSGTFIVPVTLAFGLRPPQGATVH